MEEEPQSKFNIYMQLSAIKRDLVILTVGFAFLFAGIGNSEDIHLALNTDKSLGLVVRGLFLISRLFSCALLPVLSIDKVGNKGTLVLAYGIHLVYLLASLDPRYSTLIPSSVAAGITSALLWTSTNVYITSLSVVYSKYTDDELAEATISKFFALFYSVLYLVFSIPAILSSVILSPNDPVHISDKQMSTCGANFCSNDELYAEQECEKEINTINTSTVDGIEWCRVQLYIPPPPADAYVLGGIYVGITFAGFLVILCVVRNLITGQVSTTSADPENRLTLFRQFLKSLGATFDIFRENPAIFLLNFVAFGYGTVEYFLIYDFSKAFVLCASGYHLRGYLLFTFALLASAASLALVFIYNNFCRLWMLGVSTLFVFLCILPLFVWEPTEGTKGVVFVLAILWGITHAIWNIHLSGLYGIMGRRQLSSFFANLIFWWTMGQFIGFAWSELLCLRHKLYILAPLIAATTVALTALEVWIRAPSLLKSKKIAPLLESGRLQPEGSAMQTPIKQTNAISVVETGGPVDALDAGAEKTVDDLIKSRESTPPDPRHAPSAPPHDADQESVAETEPDQQAETGDSDKVVEPEAEAEPEEEAEPEGEPEPEPQKNEPPETSPPRQEDVIVPNQEQ